MSNPAWANTRYEDVYAYLKQGIAEGRFAPGTRLDGERKIADQLEVSRETVRLGLKLAEEAGLVVRFPTRGTFVTAPRVEQDLGEMQTFQHTVRGLNLEPTYRLLAQESSEADSRQADRLEIPEGSRLFRVEVLGMASGLPMALYESYLPGWVSDKLSDDCDWGSAASYQIAAKALGLTSLRVVQEFQAISIPKRMTQTLHVKSGTPGFRCESLFTGPENAKPVELRTAWYPGSRYHFTISRDVCLD